MTDNKQILDVTYGTFSCRLEGFDDSVATMKLVAEYLHTLSDLGQFPDANHDSVDMAELAALTGGSVDDLVESDGKFQLRLRKHDLETAPDLPAAEQTPDKNDFSQNDSESVAAKLERIRAVVGLGSTSSASDDFSEDLPTAQADEYAAALTPLAQRLAGLAQRRAEQAPYSMASDDDAAEDDDTDDLIDTADLEAEHSEPQDTDIEDDTFTAEATQDENDEADDEDETPQNRGMNLASFVAGDDLNLHDEVAKVEREIDDRYKRQELSRTVDESVQRIMLQTDDHLNAPEQRQKRDSFAQLKAAAVASDAAKQLGDDGGEDPHAGDPYRDDLDDIATAEMEKSELPTDDNVEVDADTTQKDSKPLPPLRLVASQRVVDPIDPTGATEQRLHQIVSRIEKNETPQMSYAEFVEHHDATDMAELIEAGAAYVNFVQQKPDFSRPEVMRLVRAYAKEAVARENGVRLFGRLVNAERIIKLDNGRFHVAPDTPFREGNKVARG